MFLEGRVGRCMAAAGVGVTGGLFRRKPAIQSAEQLLFKSCGPIAVEGNELIMEAGEPVPRFVFGGVPTFQESKEATTELNDLLHEINLPSPKPFVSETSMIGGVSHMGVISDNNTPIPARNHVVQALCLLASSPKIQNMVASAASDQKVYDAVLDNSQIKEFILAYQTSVENVTQQGESGAGIMGKLRKPKDFVTEMVTSLQLHLPQLFESSSVDKESIKMKAFKLGSHIVEKLRNVKNSVVEMATNILKYFPNMYAPCSAAEGLFGLDAQGNTQGSPPEMSLGISLTGLVVLVIMIVVFRRV